jgi:WD40 repeat protein
VAGAFGTTEETK